ncbi:MAG: outer membrane beta-barrel protein [Spirochaetia bacterium]|nr:outer membrane beta-barrel protein [Spirochaetia bacterium]
MKKTQKKKLGRNIFILCLYFLLPLQKLNAYGSGLIDKLPDAEGNLNLGALELHPAFMYTERWSDNIYYTSENRTKDTISTITGGMLFSIGEQYQINLGYLADYHIYSENEKENFTSHNILGEIDLNFNSGLKIYALDKFIMTMDPRDISNNFFRSKRSENISKGSVGFISPSTKTEFNLGYENEYLDYLQDTNKEYDRISHTAISMFNYRFFSKLAMELEFNYLWEKYPHRIDNNIDCEYRTGFAGLSWSYKKDVKLVLMPGILGINYRNADYPDDKTWIIKSDVDYKFHILGKSQLSLTGGKKIERTPYEGSVEYQTSKGSYYEDLFASIKFHTWFTQKIMVFLKYSYSYRVYNKIIDTLAERKDNFHMGETGFGFKPLGVIMLNGKYSYAENISNHKFRNMKNHSAQFSILVSL